MSALPLSTATNGEALDGARACQGRTESAVLASADPAARISALEAEVEVQAAIIRQQAEDIADRVRTFERAAAVARIGVWECDLPTETLRWTPGVYEMFDLPCDIRPDRQMVLRLYSDASACQLSALRSQAIADRSGFTLHAEITTLSGRRRWIRVTASVECEQGVPVRIFGIKQDITDEKILSDRTRYLADFDMMTGLANRRQFQSRLAVCAEDARLTTLLIIDLDGFKQVNDTFGHAVGDECLKIAADRIAAVCGDAELVARIGGDEFAVLLGSDIDETRADRLAQEIVAALAVPMDHQGQRFQIGGSVGIAAADAPSNDPTSRELFQKADLALYAAKSGGRGTFKRFTTAGPSDRQGPPEGPGFSQPGPCPAHAHGR